MPDNRAAIRGSCAAAPGAGVSGANTAVHHAGPAGLVTGTAFFESEATRLLAAKGEGEPRARGYRRARK
jgi:hypothetical protein